MIDRIIACALVGYAFQLMLNYKEHMIFGFYGLWLKKLSEKNATGRYLAKPLGSCIICNTTWIGILASYFIFKETITISFVVGIASAGLANLIQITYTYIKNHL